MKNSPKASATYSASKRQNIPMDQIMAFENTQAWELTRTLLTFIWRLGSCKGDEQREGQKRKILQVYQ